MVVIINYYLVIILFLIALIVVKLVSLDNNTPNVPVIIGVAILEPLNV